MVQYVRGALLDVIEGHLQNPGIICFATSVEGTSVGLMDSEVVGRGGIGGLTVQAAIVLFLVEMAVVIKVYDVGLFILLTIEGEVPFKGVLWIVVGSVLLDGAGRSAAATLLVASDEDDGSATL